MECVWLCEGGLGVFVINVMLYIWNEKIKKLYDVRRGVIIEWKCVGFGIVVSFWKRFGYVFRMDIY